MLGLMILCSLLTGASGQTDLHVFRSDGENVSLPCNNDLTDCKSTAWTYSGGTSSGTVRLFENGIKNNHIKRHERLSVGSDCSLNIYKVTTEDHGVYNCYIEQTPSTDAYLHILHVSLSQIRPDRSFTLSCQLYVDDGYTCGNLLINEGIKLVWVNKSGVALQSDNRYQISSFRHLCISTLSTTLLDEDHNTEWTCQVTDRTKVKTSVSYTVTYSDTSTPAASTPVILAVTAALAALAALIALCLICKKRAGADKKADPAGVISSLTPVTPPPPPPPPADVHGRTEDVSYTEVIIFTNKFTERHNVQSDDKVTYAVIRGAELQDEGLKNC